jgi:chemotaxis signal transduction protein
MTESKAKQAEAAEIGVAGGTSQVGQRQLPAQPQTQARAQGGAARGGEVQSGAAQGGVAQLLDRAVSDDYVRETTQRIACPAATQNETTSSVVVFRVGAEWLGLATSCVQSVAQSFMLHRVPHREGLVSGMAAVGGELLLCVSLSWLLGDVAFAQPGDAAIERASQRLLVVADGATRTAFVVDEVQGVVHYRDTELKAVPSTLAAAAAVYTRGMLIWGERSVGCLDEDLIFHTLNKSLS